MKGRYQTAVVVVTIGLAAAGAVTTAAAQSSAQDGDWVVPRTEHGHPDIQGNWSNATLTQFERPRGLGPTFTREQVEALESGVASRIEAAIQPSNPDREAPPTGGDGSTGAAGMVGGYDGVYIDSGERVAVVNGEARTALVTTPDGRVPDVTPQVQQWRAEQVAFRRQFSQYDHPELRPIGERCIMSFGSNAGPPMLPNGFYNNNYTIVQNADFVMILAEMNHDTRIIRLGDGPRLPDEVRPWMGDSWGYWEGETLVVETTNLHPEQRFRNAPSDNTKVIERFTRVGEETILYEFTIDDPTVYAEAWGGQVPMHRLDDRVYEYACHEGNYSLYNVLRGARYQEGLEVQDQ
jgi:hypothetical protein